MYAIFEDSGSQIRAKVGDVLTIDLRELPESATSVSFERVLMVGGEGSAKIGTPYLGGATVKAEIVEREIKGEKLDVVTFKRRKGFRKKIGHRQRYMKVKVTDIKA